MSATLTEAPKVEDMVTIEVDGQALQARKGAMLIDVTDAAGIYIPRFCYHKKLSVAANCRMCLVEVERAPKPQPACATPVMDGMKVQTKSPKAVSGQQATMEFLLINHPLDCPICDQGGECELQDLALGYGSAVSQYTERKRVVRDKNIGPLVQTDMTRCIHCTRCVRFGEEVAGLRELGATGRGENMEIGTYVAQAMTSELSGNVIDLCPVGALTSKPYRYSARAWELRQFDAIAPHDCVGSALHVHAKGAVVKRVVPKEHEAVNETWISDRDRFSYQGLTSPDRLLMPRLRDNGQWRECDWDTAFTALAAALAQSKGAVGALMSPSSTTEECFLMQRLVRGLGSSHIDHRLRQVDFSADAHEPLQPLAAAAFSDLETADAVVIVGGYPRHDQPIVNHRIRKAALRGAAVIAIDTLALDYNFDLAAHVTVSPAALHAVIGGIARACADGAGRVNAALGAYTADAEATRIAGLLAGKGRIVVLAGNALQSAPDRAALLGVTNALAAACGTSLGLLTDGANAAGAWLAGAVPHRGPAGRPAPTPGCTAAAMPAAGLSTILLHGFELEADYADPVALRSALQGAACVAAFTSYVSAELEAVATLLLPIAAFAENEGSVVNAAGQWQSFAAAVKPPGEARAGWKVLRALGEKCALEGFTAVTHADVTREIQALCANVPQAAPAFPLQAAAGGKPGAPLILRVPMYRTDPLVRRASALQQMPQAGDDDIHMAPATLAQLGVGAGASVTLGVGDARVVGLVVADPAVPAGCCMVYATTTLAARLPATATVTLQAGG